MQRRHYDTLATSLHKAKALVHPDYERAAAVARASQGHALIEFFQRTYAPADGTLSEVAAATLSGRSIKALDFGCGVGRLMEAFAGYGVQTDGVDVSDRMLSYARENPRLRNSRFFLSDGQDCGDASTGVYDLVYSQLCIQHICSRTIRKRLLAEFKRVLKPGGVVLLQMRYHPDQTAASVPRPHGPWSDDNYNAQTTNSGADVWVTPDELHLVYSDFAAHFHDLRFQFVDIPRKADTPATGAWAQQLIVSGSTTQVLAERLYSASGYDAAAIITRQQSLIEQSEERVRSLESQLSLANERATKLERERGELERERGQAERRRREHDWQLACRSLEDKRVVGWGTGAAFRRDHAQNPVPLAYLVDNNETSWGRRCEDTLIEPPARLRKEDPRDVIIVVYSAAFDAIATQIAGYGPFTVVPSDVVAQYAAATAKPRKPGADRRRRLDTVKSLSLAV